MNPVASRNVKFISHSDQGGRRVSGILCREEP